MRSKPDCVSPGSCVVVAAMNERNRVALSKRLSYHLPHAPERIGIELAEGGWVDVDVLLAALAAHGTTTSRAQLELVVADSDKQRFAFDPTGTRIRASQGHSVEVDGFYPTWLGRTSGGEVACFVADMLVLDEGTVLD